MRDGNFTVIFKTVPSLPEYAAGSDGSIWSMKSGSWKKLRPCPNKSGYLLVNVSGKNRQVSHLILEAHVGRRPDGMECRHFPDRSPSNNCLWNISWATKSVNQRDRKFHGTTKRRAEEIPDGIRLMVALNVECGHNTAVIASHFKIHRRTVQKIYSKYKSQKK